MESVYGRKRMAADEGARETWMDRFTQLEPDGGFGAIVRQAWNHTGYSPNGARPLTSLNGRMELKPVYGQKSSAGTHETWMDRFTQLEPEGGFRAAVVQAWSSSASTLDNHLETLAA